MTYFKVFLLLCCYLNLFLPYQNKRVLLIGIDGLLSLCLNEADHNAWEKITSKGSYTFKARSTIQNKGGPSWSNVLCGMTVEETGITTNS